MKHGDLNFIPRTCIESKIWWCAYSLNIGKAEAGENVAFWAAILSLSTNSGPVSKNKVDGSWEITAKIDLQPPHRSANMHAYPYTICTHAQIFSSVHYNDIFFRSLCIVLIASVTYFNVNFSMWIILKFFFAFWSDKVSNNFVFYSSIQYCQNINFYFFVFVVDVVSSLLCRVRIARCVTFSYIKIHLSSEFFQLSFAALIFWRSGVHSQITSGHFEILSNLLFTEMSICSGYYILVFYARNIIRFSEKILSPHLSLIMAYLMEKLNLWSEKCIHACLSDIHSHPPSCLTSITL